MNEPELLPVDCAKLTSLVDEILNLRGCESNICAARSLAYEIRDLVPRYTVPPQPISPAQRLQICREFVQQAEKWHEDNAHGLLGFRRACVESLAELEAQTKG